MSPSLLLPTLAGVAAGLTVGLVFALLYRRSQRRAETWTKCSTPPRAQASRREEQGHQGSDSDQAAPEADGGQDMNGFVAEQSPTMQTAR